MNRTKVAVLLSCCQEFKPKQALKLDFLQNSGMHCNVDSLISMIGNESCSGHAVFKKKNPCTVSSKVLGREWEGIYFTCESRTWHEDPAQIISISLCISIYRLIIVSTSWRREIWLYTVESWIFIWIWSTVWVTSWLWIRIKMYACNYTYVDRTGSNTTRLLYSRLFDLWFHLPLQLVHR